MTAHRGITRAAIAGLVLVLVTGMAAPAAAARLFILTIQGGTITLEVESSDTIENVKQKTQDKTDIPAAAQTMYFEGVELRNGLTLADYNVPANATLLLRYRGDEPAVIEVIALPGWLPSYERASSVETCAEGWGSTWAQWPNEGTGGWTCDREIPSLG